MAPIPKPCEKVLVSIAAIMRAETNFKPGLPLQPYRFS
jgi:hypothetical protein